MINFEVNSIETNISRSWGVLHGLWACILHCIYYFVNLQKWEHRDYFCATLYNDMTDLLDVGDVFDK